MLESSFHVQAFPRRPVQDPSSSQVHDETADTDKQDRHSNYVNVFLEGPMLGLEENPAGDKPQGEGVDQRSQYLGAVIPDVRSTEAFLLAIHMATKAMTIAAASVSMCPASANKARLPDIMPPMISATM